WLIWNSLKPRSKAMQRRSTSSLNGATPDGTTKQITPITVANWRRSG
ncbi:hypothetical protein AVDCRST_MAG94-1397, partial [uncultured Leptolyngbya sp.]